MKGLHNVAYLEDIEENIDMLPIQHTHLNSKQCNFPAASPLHVCPAEERTGGGGVQLQLSGSGPPPSLLILLAAPREGLHPLHLVEESYSPLREARRPGATTQRHRGCCLCVCEEPLVMSLYLLHVNR